MRSEAEIREHLTWLKNQCRLYREEEAERIIRQLEVLLWVLGHDRDQAEEMAVSIWQNSRSARGRHPRDS